MLQLMMENRGKVGKSELSIEDMVSQAFVFFFGGFDSTSTLMCFAAHEIAVNPNVQERLQNEIDQVLEETIGTSSRLFKIVFQKFPPSKNTRRILDLNFSLIFTASTE